MWIELVPMSMAAMRMQVGQGLPGSGLCRYTVVIYWLGRPTVPQEPLASWANPTMNRAPSRSTRLLLERRARALKRHLPAAIEWGRDRRPPGPRGLASPAGGRAGAGSRREAWQGEKAQRQGPQADEGPWDGPRARRHADGAQRARRARASLPTLALEEVASPRGEEREHRRATMLKRLEKVKVDKLDRRLASVAEALQERSPRSGGTRWRRDWRSGRRRSRQQSRMRGRCTTRRACIVSDCAPRVACTVWRSQAEGGFPDRRAAVVRQLKKCGHALGRLHDLQVLLTHVAAQHTMPLARELPEGSSTCSRGRSKRVPASPRPLHVLSPALGTTAGGNPGVVALLLRPAGRIRSASRWR